MEESNADRGDDLKKGVEIFRYRSPGVEGLKRSGAASGSMEETAVFAP